MVIKEGDLVITLPKVEKIRAIVDNVVKDQIGIVVSRSSKFDEKTVYGVLLDGEVYYLFEDEVELVEEKC
tara:strand:- start:1455 stop:1664 length:210 start_codon:yes stop_codon:yes gene_type:complete